MNYIRCPGEDIDEDFKEPEQLMEEAARLDAQFEEARRSNQAPPALFNGHDGHAASPERTPKKKIPTAVFILILLIGFMVVAGTAVWIESKHNQCVVDLNECAKECIKIPQEDLEGGEWYGKYLVGT